MVTVECLMATLDLKDAYCVKIDHDYQKYLRFLYDDKLYQSTVYRNGLSSCHTYFTNIMKPILCALREKGHLVIIFIDDLLIIAHPMRSAAHLYWKLYNFSQSLGLPSI